MDNEPWIMNDDDGSRPSMVTYARQLFFIIHFSLSIFHYLSAQPPAPATIPSGRFLTDSFEVGRPFRYALSFRHPVNEDVLFPDSTVFAPFVVREKAYLPTRSDAEISTDSAVYTLVLFETRPQLTLRVPLYVVGGTDCTLVYSSVDTVFFRSRLPTARLDTLRLQTDTQIIPLRQELNYPLLVFVLGGLGMLGGLIYALFGRLITRQLRLFRLRQRHRTFLREYNRIVQQIRVEASAEGAYQAIIRWKNYLQQVEQQPYASMTTPELVERISMRDVALPNIQGRSVLEALRTVDRMIYGGTYSNQADESLDLLREVAVAIYEQRRTTLTRPGSTTNLFPKTAETV
jgi:hypothetical protein